MYCTVFHTFVFVKLYSYIIIQDVYHLRYQTLKAWWYCPLYYQYHPHCSFYHLILLTMVIFYLNSLSLQLSHLLFYLSLHFFYLVVIYIDLYLYLSQVYQQQKLSHYQPDIYISYQNTTSKYTNNKSIWWIFNFS